MIKYIGKRILMMIPVLLGITFIIYAIMDLTPGDPARMALGEGATIEAIEQKREEMGLNDNFFVRYGRYIYNAIKGEFPKSYQNNIPVTNEVLGRFPTTIKLALMGTVLSVIIGVPLGIISAVKQYSFVDNVTLVLAMLLTSIPAFWMGLMMILLFSLKLDLLPATGIDTWKHFILPGIAVAINSMASLIRLTRSSMLEVIRADYIRTAKAKGASKKCVIFKHALRNAMLPVVTQIGLNFGRQLGGAIIIEQVFAIPGLGTLMINSVRMKDTPMVMMSITFVAMVAGFVNLGVDLLYTLIDPRVKTSFYKA